MEYKNEKIRNLKEKKPDKVNLIDLSFARGVDGMKVTWNMIHDSLEMLSQEGIYFYFL